MGVRKKMKRSLLGMLVLSFLATLASGAEKKSGESIGKKEGQNPMLEAQGKSTQALQLPSKVGSWQLGGPAQIITPAKIFEYMDGAGELYLGYRFDRLEAYEYQSPAEDSILVELYWMKSPEDAYGLLSGDWGGERVVLSDAPGKKEASIYPDADALYGAGLLRLRAGNLYARIMAYNETPESRRAVLDLGRLLMLGRKLFPPPALVRALPGSVGELYRLRVDRVSYLRSHLVFNSVFFLSTENLLRLGQSQEAVVAVYQSQGGDEKKASIHLILIRYGSPEEAVKAFEGFRRGYLAEKGKKEASPAEVVQIEDGWAGCRLNGKELALVFECPDRETAHSFLGEVQAAIEKLRSVRP